MCSVQVHTYCHCHLHWQCHIFWLFNFNFNFCYVFCLIITILKEIYSTWKLFEIILTLGLPSCKLTECFKGIIPHDSSKSNNQSLVIINFCLIKLVFFFSLLVLFTFRFCVLHDKINTKINLLSKKVILLIMIVLFLPICVHN